LARVSILDLNLFLNEVSLPFYGAVPGRAPTLLATSFISRLNS